MIDMDEFDWDDGFYDECDMYRDGKFESPFNKVFFIVFGVCVLMFVAVIFALSSCNKLDKQINDRELVTVYDTPNTKDDILQEGLGACSECGMEGYTIDGNIVCRNEDCPNYGLAEPAIMPETENQ